MKFLIDGHATRVQFCLGTWPDLVSGQLITPLTGYRLGVRMFAIDNGAYSNFNERRFRAILSREEADRKNCLFVAMPDVVGNHRQTFGLWQQYVGEFTTWKKAFVAQDGFTSWPSDAHALFIGGSTRFKDSAEAVEIVRSAKEAGLHVHVGRVNTAARFIAFRKAGADTCDGSGVSRYDHMLTNISDAIRAQSHRRSLF